MGLGNFGSTIGGIAKGLGIGAGKGWTSLGDAFATTATNMAENAEQFVKHNVNKSSRTIIDMAVGLDDSVKNAYQKISKDIAESGERVSTRELLGRVNSEIGGKAGSIDKIAELGKDNEVFQKAIKQYNSGNSTISKMGKEGADKVALAAEFAGNESGKLGKMQLAEGFLNHETYGKTRKAVTYGTAYAGGALAVRHLSGGTATRNANGQSDIAGIPII